MKVRLFLAVLPLSFGGLLWAASPVVDELPLVEKIYPQLDPILKRAVQQSPRMISSSLTVEIAEQNTVQARSGMLPYLAAFGRFLQTKDERLEMTGTGQATNTYDTDKTYYDIAVTQPLFYWGERKNNARIGKINQLVAEGNYREAYRALAMEIRSSYVGLIYKKIYLARCKYNQNFSQQQLRIAEEKLAKRTISDLQISGYRLGAENADLAVDRAEFDFDAAKRSFARLTGGDAPADDQIPDSMPALAYPAAAFDQLLAGYLGQKDPLTLEAVNARYQLDIEKLNLANNKTRLLPKFNFTAGTNQDEQRYTLNTAPYKVNSLYYGVGVSWTIFDGLASRAAVKTSLARRRQIENDYAQLLSRLSQQAQTSVKFINFSARSMSISDRALQGAEGMLRTRQEDFKRGDMAEADVSLAELGVYDARLSALNSRMDYLYRVGDFLGQLVEDPALANLNLPDNK